MRYLLANGRRKRMRTRVHPEWIEKIRDEYNKSVEQERKVNIDRTTSFLPAAQWLITFLSGLGIPFKVTNLGAGVKRITTETDICPCCKKKL